MLENGKMGLLRRVFEVIFGHNVINRLFFKVISEILGTIRGHLFWGINGLRPANLDCRITSGNDNKVECVTFGNDSRVMQLGRSMIEMLGVLAIIAVLSVGGIAGYSKALMKWKSNVQKNMLAELLTNMIKIRPNLDKKSTSFNNITYVFEAMGALPEGITYKNNYMYDKEDNLIWIDYGLSSWTNEDGSIGTQFSYVLHFNYKIGTGNITISAKDFCLNLLEAAKTIAEEVVYVKTNYNDSSSWDGVGQNIMYTKRSLETATMADMQQKCNMVIKEDGGVKFSLMINPY